MNNQHQSVLLEETLQLWLTDRDGIYIDATFGRGGHTKALLGLLSDRAKVIGIDQDETAVEYAKNTIKDSRFVIEHGSFADIAAIVTKHKVQQKVTGILLDIGVSSPQLDVAERGFSFMQDGPLDMRMNQQHTMDAKKWLNQAKEADMAAVFKTYGEERFSKRIAHAICLARQEQEITRTKQLADIVAKAHPRWEKHKHPATRVFQAIRIYINDELNALEKALSQSVELLKPAGRIVVISFHSLEDRIVKRFFKLQSQGKALPKGLPIMDKFLEKKLKLVSKAVKASEEEIKHNPRSRSAVLRAAEKIKI